MQTPLLPYTSDDAHQLHPCGLHRDYGCDSKTPTWMTDRRTCTSFAPCERVTVVLRMYSAQTKHKHRGPIKLHLFLGTEFSWSSICTTPATMGPGDDLSRRHWQTWRKVTGCLEACKPTPAGRSATQKQASLVETSRLRHFPGQLVRVMPA